MRAVMRTVQQVARFDANVLIYGESGTGKELLARIMHQKSNRKDKPFVPVNCGTLSGALFESKLFGHEVGAFTGATKKTKGRFEQAHQGTLFLDEVSEISQRNQVNFLRVLEDGRFRRIGGETPTKVDVRIIAATNKDLEAAVEAGNFRQDLYYRLQVIPINLQPLRNRREAIPHLVDYFLKRFSAIYQKEVLALAPEALKYLVSHEWPGNIRQLKNLMERMVLMAQSAVISKQDFPDDFVPGAIEQATTSGPVDGIKEVSPHEAVVPEGIEPLRKARERVEKALILRALQKTGGQRTKAAELLEIKPRTLRQKMSDYRITFTRKKTKKAMKLSNNKSGGLQGDGE
jgi:DNA-binding NtrC family response regulator